MNIPFKILDISAILVLLFSGCQPEMPVTSSILIDLEGYSVPVNQGLYGVTIEEINHAIDGGIYAEMIQNRSFEEGVPPLNCPYDARRNVLSTPNGWTIPFVRPDSVPGWRTVSPNTSIWPDGQETINERNKRSLLVSVSASSTGRGALLLPVITGFPYVKEKNMNCLYF